jgi:hypothetical protein
VELQGTAFTEHIARTGTGYHLTSYDALKSGRIEEHHDAMVVDDDAVARGLADGTLVADTRLRDALRSLRRGGTGARRFALASEGGGPLRFAAPSVADEAEYAAEAAALSDAYVVRAQRRLDALEERLRSLEHRR